MEFRIPLDRPQSFALLVRSAYGDLIMVDALMRLIKKQNANNTITLFVDTKNHQLAKYFEACNNIVVLPAKGNKYLFLTYYGLKYRKHKYEVGIAAKVGTGSTGSIFLFFLGAKKRISYTRGNFTARLINYPIPYNESIFHNQHYAIGILELLVKNTGNTLPVELYPQLSTNEITIHKKKKHNINLFVSVTNTCKTSQLTNKKTAAIISNLSNQYNLSITISSHPDDSDIAHELSSMLNTDNCVIISKNLDQLIEALANSDICLLGDGGLVHMASALNIPMVALYPRIDDAITTWIPLNKNFIMLKNESSVNNIPSESITSSLSKIITHRLK